MKKTIDTFLLFACYNFTFGQDEKNIDSEIKSVIVYQQGAQITRIAKCNLPKGKTTLVFNGLSSKIDPKNLQVKPDNDNVMIVSVSHNIDFLNKNKTSKQIEEMEQKKRNILDSLKILKNIKLVYSQEREMIIANKSIGGQNGVNINELQSAATFFRSRLSEIENNSYQLDRKSFLLKERLVEISKQLIELNSQLDLPTSQIKVVVSTEKAIETLINFDYLIADASWNPNYDIRIKDIDNPLNLTYKAKVSQNTGEDWNDVKLTLSTGNPSISNSKPNLDNYYLTFNNYYSNYKPSYSNFDKQFNGKVEGRITDADNGEPLVGCTIMVKGTTNGTVANLDGKFSISVPDANSILEFSFVGYETKELNANSSFENVTLKPSVVSLDEVVVVGYGTSSGEANSSNYVASLPKNKEIIPLAIQKQQTSTEFKIDVPYSIPSDNKEYDVAMIQYEVPALYSYSAVPKLSNDVYLVAKLTDWVKYNILNGTANLFFKGIYQGQTFLDLKSFEDTLSLSIGRDKDIIIQREIQKDFTSKNFVSSYKKELKGWNITIKNNKEISVKMTIEDQFPISKSDDIKVELIESSGASQDKDSGKLTWNIDLNPKEKKVLLLKYSVKYPKDKKVLVE
jgi:hypothetical protein